MASISPINTQITRLISLDMLECTSPKGLVCNKQYYFEDKSGSVHSKAESFSLSN